MPEGMTLNIAKGQYPKLENMGDNNKFKFSGEARVDWQGENGTISFDSFDIQTENSADKELRNMKGEQMPMGMSDSEEDGGI
jgi:hypothetical protein